jgi:hypothetical protein
MSITTLVCKKNANFFTKNGQKSQKIVIKTSTPGAGSAKKLSWCAALSSRLWSLYINAIRNMKISRDVAWKFRVTSHENFAWRRMKISRDVTWKFQVTSHENLAWRHMKISLDVT